MQGLLLQVIGGFYYVEAADTVYECKARGALRRGGMSPVAGDCVTVTVTGDGKGVLETVLPRRNVLVRPPVANVDVLAIVVSVTQPRPHLLLVDKMIALAEQHEIEPVVVVTKTDLTGEDFPVDTYRKAGFAVFSVTSTDVSTVLPLKAYLQGKVTAFTGNSGVGKSTLLNAMEPTLMRETGEISQKLGRGRHTTRCAELIKLPDGGYLVDTPGFSALDAERVALPEKEELASCFREFETVKEPCRFTGCSHVHEPDCAVRKAVEKGRLARSRYDSYVALYQEVAKRKQW